MIIKIIKPETAVESILRRKRMDLDFAPPIILERIKQTFGEELTPQKIVKLILTDIRERGDVALTEWTDRLDQVSISRFRVAEEEINSAKRLVPTNLWDSLRQSAERIEAFYRRQPLTSWFTQDTGGMLGQIIRPIERVGLYIPGGTAPLPSSVLMSAIPARVAGVPEIVLVSPPGKDGKIPSVILASASICGIKEIYSVGGAQAIAALAYGTKQIPAVDKIMGPGNLFVTLAKREVFGIVGIDGLAGPTETILIADEYSRADWIALDLLAQAEHDVLASALLITPSEQLALDVQKEIEALLSEDAANPFSRSQIIRQSLSNQGGIVVTSSIEEAISLSNQYAPEHLSLSLRDPWKWIDRISSAGGIFLGEYSFEVLGDYAAGPSHVMPTNATARFASPLNVWDFVRIINLVGLTQEAAKDLISLSSTIARAEGLDAHARSAEARIQ